MSRCPGGPVTFTAEHLTQIIAVACEQPEECGRPASFVSLDALKQRLVDFIGYFNAVLAKPFRWTYAGKPLRAQ